MAHEPMVYHGKGKDGRVFDYTIPPGQPISIDLYTMHYNTDAFPEPALFKPERWLEKGKRHHKLDEYMIPFQRGTRQCLGMK